MELKQCMVNDFVVNGFTILDTHLDEIGINTVDPVMYYGTSLAKHLVDQAKVNGRSFYYDLDDNVLKRLIHLVDKELNVYGFIYGIRGHMIEIKAV